MISFSDSEKQHLYDHSSKAELVDEIWALRGLAATLELNLRCANDEVEKLVHLLMKYGECPDWGLKGEGILGPCGKCEFCKEMGY